MGIIATIGTFLKVALFMLNLWSEKDKEKAQKKAEIADEIVKAFRETDDNRKRSRVASAIDRINRLR